MTAGKHMEVPETIKPDELRDIIRMVTEPVHIQERGTLRMLQSSLQGILHSFTPEEIQKAKLKLPLVLQASNSANEGGGTEFRTAGSAAAWAVLEPEPAVTTAHPLFRKWDLAGAFQRI